MPHTTKLIMEKFKPSGNELPDGFDSAPIFIKAL